MKLFLLTALTMFAFAANSILNRLALAEGAIGPAGFASIRVAAGAAVLAVLLIVRDRSALVPERPNYLAVAGLSAYMVGFSFAYVSMDAGLGALVLFAGVQITMFLGALAEGERPQPRRWVGMAAALSGLAFLSVPAGPVALHPGAFALMACAAAGWGIYSLIGRTVTDPLRATGWNFLYSLPVVLLALYLRPDATEMNANGVLLAMASGGVTSALGYALWYSLLPRLGATTGALAQLSAPAIALGLGALVLGETVTWSQSLAAVLILGGIAIGLLPVNRPVSKP